MSPCMLHKGIQIGSFCFPGLYIICCPTPQVLQQQVMCKARKQTRAKVKAPTTATQEDDKECHKILQRQHSYHTKVKAL